MPAETRPRNEAAERLLNDFVNGPGGFGYAGVTADELRQGLDAALTEERRLVVKRIRERVRFTKFEPTSATDAVLAVLRILDEVEADHD
jgi:hypothetical protein